MIHFTLSKGPQKDKGNATGKVLAFHASDQGSSPGIPFGHLSPEVTPEL